MRKFAFVLLILGFVWLCGAAFYFDLDTARSSSHARDALPPKDSFTRDEVMQHISFIYRLLPDRALWLALPASVMLAGGLMLGFAPQNATPSTHDHAA